MNAPDDDRRVGEAGDTLIEVLLAIAILGIAIVVILAGLGTAVTTSTQHRSQATANTLLVSAAESVKAAAFVTCASTSSYSTTAGVTIPAGWSSPAVTSVQYWDGTSFFSGACPASTTNRKLQLVTVQVGSPDGKATESITVLKRDPA